MGEWGGGGRPGGRFGGDGGGAGERRWGRGRREEIRVLKREDLNADGIFAKEGTSGKGRGIFGMWVLGIFDPPFVFG